MMIIHHKKRDNRERSRSRERVHPHAQVPQEPQTQPLVNQEPDDVSDEDFSDMNPSSPTTGHHHQLNREVAQEETRDLDRLSLHIRRRAERVNRLCKMNSEAQKLTMTGIHPVQIYGHTAQGASNAQVDAMCRNLKLGTVLGKTQACPITTVAWFFGVKRVPQTAARVEQISEWISMWRNCNVDTRRRIRRFGRKKAPVLAGNPRRWNQATGPISATICSVLEAGWKPSSPGFWQSQDGSATLDGALFNKAQIIDSFFSDMEMQTWKAATRHSSSSGLEKRHHHRFCQESQISVDQRR